MNLSQVATTGFFFFLVTKFKAKSELSNKIKEIRNLDRWATEEIS